MPRFQYMSDLHLELFPGFRVSQVTAPYLILAGDVGDPASDEYAGFVADCVGKYERVFVVLGNHESYGRSWQETCELADRVLLARGAVLLNRSGWTFAADVGQKRLRIIGATLWSHVDPEVDDAYLVRTMLSDFRLIRKFGLPEYADEHARDVAWIRAEIALADVDDADLIVVTHHAPSLRGTSHPKHAGSPLNCAFASDLDGVLLVPPVKAWIYGHTHYSNAQTLSPSGVRLLSNQRGYADNAEEGEGFREDASFEA